MVSHGKSFNSASVEMSMHPVAFALVDLWSSLITLYEEASTRWVMGTPVAGGKRPSHERPTLMASMMAHKSPGKCHLGGVPSK